MQEKTLYALLAHTKFFKKRLEKSVRYMYNTKTDSKQSEPYFLL